MPAHDQIMNFAAEMTQWRRDFHRHPEIGLEEHRTSAIVAEKLAAWGFEVSRGLAGTGVVGTLRRGHSKRTIGIRADMDALAMTEAGGLHYRSVHEGLMHACGHDGHTATLLGAARYLAETRNFDGTVHLIFQPAEEGRGGARKMIEDGLFEKFPCDSIYALHNDPHGSLGTVAVKAGAVTAASERFWIHVGGRGGHAARPQDSIDPIVIGSLVVVALQTILARRLGPLDCGVVSVTQFHAGSAGNVIPSEALLNGTIRAHSPEVHERLKAWVEEIAGQTARAHGATAAVTFENIALPTINSPAPTRVMTAVAGEIFGAENVVTDRSTAMGGEDFAEMALRVPACFVFIGQATDIKGSIPVHRPEYDFNDDLLPLAASLWAGIVERELPACAQS